MYSFYVAGLVGRGLEAITFILAASVLPLSYQSCNSFYLLYRAPSPTPYKLVMSRSIPTLTILGEARASTKRFLLTCPGAGQIFSANTRGVGTENFTFPTLEAKLLVLSVKLAVKCPGGGQEYFMCKCLGVTWGRGVYRMNSTIHKHHCLRHMSIVICSALQCVCFTQAIKSDRFKNHLYPSNHKRCECLVHFSVKYNNLSSK